MNISINKKIIYNFFSKENILSLMIITIIFISDRLTKIKIINLQDNNKSIYINEYLNFDLVWNTGIGFGLFDMDANLTYHIISLIILIVILFIIFIIIKSTNLEKFFYAIILGGAFGNLYDRISYFAVPDFIDIHINDYHWFTFNIADIFITLGIILILIKETKKNHNE
jgi:signal peptidase II